jgi:hypothetical protein
MELLTPWFQRSVAVGTTSPWGVSESASTPLRVATIGPAIIKRLQDRLSIRLAELEIDFTRERLDQIVAIYFPDLRAVVNHLDYEFV